MENILQSLIKIIIIGSLYKTAFVECNRQFLPPPLPYYPNGNFFVPEFAAGPPPYHEPLPVYYREENPPPPPPPPISYQNMNAYPPPQLFHRNENYNPLPLATPNMRYSLPQIYPDYNQPYKAQPTFNRQVGFKKPLQTPTETQVRPTESPKKKPAFYATNIIIKEESQPPYYSDEYNKNYHDEDYSDNYSDESPSQPDPCVLNSPYRYFEPPKPDPNNPNIDDKFTLCSSYFQPNFGNSIYAVKMPITLLPSRFPPRVEQLIERIQNYFSTYTQTLKPENETLTTPQPLTQSQANTTTENINKTNTTEENLQPSPESTNLNPSTAAVENEEVTPNTITAIIPSESESTTANPAKNDSEVVGQSVQPPAESASTTIETPQGEFTVSLQQSKLGLETTTPAEVSQKPEESQNFPEIELELIDSKGLETTTQSVVMNNRTEEVFTLKEGLLNINVTDSNG